MRLLDALNNIKTDRHKHIHTATQTQLLWYGQKDAKTGAAQSRTVHRKWMCVGVNAWVDGSVFVRVTGRQAIISVSVVREPGIAGRVWEDWKMI